MKKTAAKKTPLRLAKQTLGSLTNDKLEEVRGMSGCMGCTSTQSSAGRLLLREPILVQQPYVLQPYYIKLP